MLTTAIVQEVAVALNELPMLADCLVKNVLLYLGYIFKMRGEVSYFVSENEVVSKPELMKVETASC